MRPGVADLAKERVGRHTGDGLTAGGTDLQVRGDGGGGALGHLAEAKGGQFMAGWVHHGVRHGELPFGEGGRKSFRLGSLAPRVVTSLGSRSAQPRQTFQKNPRSVD